MSDNISKKNNGAFDNFISTFMGKVNAPPEKKKSIANMMRSQMDEYLKKDAILPLKWPNKDVATEKFLADTLKTKLEEILGGGAITDYDNKVKDLVNFDVNVSVSKGADKSAPKVAQIELPPPNKSFIGEIDAMLTDNKRLAEKLPSVTVLSNAKMDSNFLLSWDTKTAVTEDDINNVGDTQDRQTLRVLVQNARAELNDKLAKDPLKTQYAEFIQWFDNLSPNQKGHFLVGTYAQLGNKYTVVINGDINNDSGGMDIPSTDSMLKFSSIFNNLDYGMRMMLYLSHVIDPATSKIATLSNNQFLPKATNEIVKMLYNVLKQNVTSMAIPFNTLPVQIQKKYISDANNPELEAFLEKRHDYLYLSPPEKIEMGYRIQKDLPRNFDEELNKLVSKQKELDAMMTKFKKKILTTSPLETIPSTDSTSQNTDMDRFLKYQEAHPIIKSFLDTHSDAYNLAYTLFHKGVLNIDTLRSWETTRNRGNLISGGGGGNSNLEVGFNEDATKRLLKINEWLLDLDKTRCTGSVSTCELMMNHTLRILRSILQGNTNTYSNNMSIIDLARQCMHKNNTPYYPSPKVSLPNEKYDATQLQEQLESAREELKNVTQARNELETVRQKLENDNKALNDALKEYTQAQNDLARVRRELEASTKAQKDLANASTKAQNDLANASTQAHEQLATVQQELAQARNELARVIPARNNAVNEANLRALEVSTQAQQQLATVQQELAQARNELARVRNKLADATQAQNDLANASTQAQQQLATVQQELAQARNDLERGRNELADATQAQQQLANASTQAQQQLATVQQELAQARAELANATKARNDLKRVQLELANVRDELARVIPARNNAVNEANLRALEVSTQAQQQLATVQQELAQARNELADATQAQTDLANASTQAQQQLATVQQELAQARNELADATQAQTDLANASTQAQQQLATVQQELAQARNELADATQAQTDLANASTQAQQQLATVQQELAQARNELADATQAQTDLANASTQAQQQLATVQQELAQARAELANATKARNDLKRVQLELANVRDELARVIPARNNAVNEANRRALEVSTQAHEQLATVQQELAQARNDLERGRNELADATQAQNDLANASTQAHEQLATMRHELAQARNELANATQARNDLIRNILRKINEIRAELGLSINQDIGGLHILNDLDEIYAIVNHMRYIYAHGRSGVYGNQALSVIYNLLRLGSVETQRIISSLAGVAKTSDTTARIAKLQILANSINNLMVDTKLIIDQLPSNRATGIVKDISNKIEVKERNRQNSQNRLPSTVSRTGSSTVSSTGSSTGSRISRHWGGSMHSKTRKTRSSPAKEEEYDYNHTTDWKMPVGRV